MSSNNVVAIQDDKPLSAARVREGVNVIQQVMHSVMQAGVHYGTIGGTDNPTLLKPGAEKIMATFRLAADPEITDLSTEDVIRYRVKVRMTSPSGAFVGAGVGECSSNEEKYKWRNAVCEEEFEATPHDRRREKWCKGYGNNPAYIRYMVRTEPSDLANTILKMAKKRALVDGVLTATAASDIFTQDIEDLPPEYLDDGAPVEGEVIESERPAQHQQPRQQQRQQPRQQQQRPAAPRSKQYSGDATATEPQVKMLRAKLRNSIKEESDLCVAFKIDCLEAMPKRSVDDAINWIME